MLNHGKELEDAVEGSSRLLDLKLSLAASNLVALHLAQGLELSAVSTVEVHLQHSPDLLPGSTPTKGLTNTRLTSPQNLVNHR